MRTTCSSCSSLEATDDLDPDADIGDEEAFTVAEVVRRTGTTRKALRVYEHMDLVRPCARTEAGYRLYDVEALRHLGLVARAKLLGLSLAEMKEFIALADSCSGESHCDLVAMLERKLVETEQRMAEIASLRDNLLAVLDGGGWR